MTYLEPVLPATLALLFIALLARRRRPRLSWVMVAVAAGGLFLWSWEPVAQLTASSFEGRYPERALPEGDAEAIVVLSAAVRLPRESRPEALLDSQSLERTSYAGWLYRNWKAVPILASGGAMGPRGRRVVVADVMKQALVADGVPEEMVWTERRSSSTYWNAVRSAEILRERGIRRIALVTEAYHMPRAELCFRKQGLEVVPAPCGFRSTQPIESWTDLVPATRAIGINEDVLHEWVALAYYRLRGWI